jgi:hypothetical protein
MQETIANKGRVKFLTWLVNKGRKGNGEGEVSCRLETGPCRDSMIACRNASHRAKAGRSRGLIHLNWVNAVNECGKDQIHGVVQLNMTKTPW